MKNTNLTDKIAQKIEITVYSGKLAPGSKLPPERELAADYNVSRPIVHNAIIKLQEKGLVRILPRHGVEVIDFRMYGKLNLLDSIVDLYKEELSDELKTSLITFFSTNINSIILLICNNKHEVGHSLHAAPDAIKAAQDEEEAAGLLFGFYHALGISSGNEIFPLLINTMKLGIINVSRYMLRSEELRNSCADSLESLIKALEEGLYTNAVDINQALLDIAKKMWR